MSAQPGTLEAWYPVDGMHSPDMGAGHVSSAGPSEAILHWTPALDPATVGFGFGDVGIVVAAGQPESPSKIQTWQPLPSGAISTLGTARMQGTVWTSAN